MIRNTRNTSSRFQLPCVLMVAVITGSTGSPDGSAAQQGARAAATSTREGAENGSNPPPGANVVLLIPQTAIASQFQQTIDRTQQGICDVILGTPTRSDIRTRGATAGVPQASDQSAVIQTTSDGQLLVNSTGTNRGVTTRSCGRGSFFSSAWITISPHGVSTSQPDVSIDMTTTICGISAGGPLRQRIAERQVAKSKAQADCIGRRKAEARMRRSLHSELAARAEQFDARLNELIGELERDYDIRRKDLHFRSDSQGITAAAIVGAGTESDPLSAANDYASLPLLNIHQSLFDHLTKSLAGTSLSSEDVEQKAQEEPFLSQLMGSGDAAQPSKNWAITFADRDPILVRFSDGKVDLRFRTVRFEIGEEVQNRTLSFVITLRPETTDSGGIRLVVEQWDILPTRAEEGGRIAASEQLIRRRFRTQLQDVIRDVEIDSFQLPEQWQWSGTVQLRDLRLDNGWLSAAIETASSR